MNGRTSYYPQQVMSGDQIFLRNLFSSETNVRMLMDSIIENLVNLGAPRLEKSNPEFLKIFNQVATQIFNAEKDNLRRVLPEQGLDVLNDIVIKEMTKFLLEKIKSSSINTNVKDTKTQEPEIILKDTRFLIKSNQKIFDKPLENCISMKLKELYINNDGIVVNSNSDRIYYKEVYSNDPLKPLHSESIEIKIDQKHYSDISELLEELNKNGRISFCLNNENKIVISSNTHIFFLKTGNDFNLLKILGFFDDFEGYISSGNLFVAKDSYCLNKTKSVELIIKSEEKILFNEPLILREKNNYKELDYSIDLTSKTETIPSISVFFKVDRNDTITDFCIILQVTQKTLKNS
ncbi:MAG TPA: hypothetical protein V6C58_05760 [Allocoleopsis sp.]